MGLRAGVTGSGVTVAVDSGSEVATPARDLRTWVSTITVSGVKDGDDPVAFINNRMVRPGTIVDHRLGIHFDRIVSAHRLLVFEDESGASVGKRY
ncbi:MAG: hypothetical protein J6386_14885 [Candidatus Synoicihabitans palmerolidicus]|nr:hypothetical protein [Candidatus Synoicihabitans palmerolidicus]